MHWMLLQAAAAQQMGFTAANTDANTTAAAAAAAGGLRVLQEGMQMNHGYLDGGSDTLGREEPVYRVFDVAKQQFLQLKQQQHRLQQ